MRRPLISDEVWNQNYRAPDESTLEDTWKRQSVACASVEKPEIRDEIEKDFYWLLSDFKGIAGGRITANLGVEGRSATTLMNCFVSNPGDIGYKDVDSIEGIYDMLKAQAHTLKSEGGYGMNFSWIRPAGAYVKGIGGRTPGVLKFMELWDKSSEIITSGYEEMVGGKRKEEKKKIRKGAQMAILNCTHPDILSFIDAKLTPGRLTKFNLSVGVTDGFMDAVINDKDWDLKFPDTDHPEYKDVWNGDIYSWEAKGLPVIIYKTIPAKQIWEKIMHATYTRNDPGVIFLDIANKLNPLKYAETLQTTNPCFHGDTLIAVADGRGAITIKQLADEGKDVPVYSVDMATGNVEIKLGRHPRITGYDQELVRVNLDDGTYLDVTPNHKFITLDGVEKTASELIHGDSLPRFNKFQDAVKKGSKPYYRVQTNVLNNKKSIFEHRLVAKYYYRNEWDSLYDFLKINGFAKTGGIVVHHKDYNQLNNRPENLQIMSFKDHSKLHGEIDQSGEKNGKFSGLTHDQIREKGMELTKTLGRRFSHTEWVEFAAKNNIPQAFSKYRTQALGSIEQFAISCAIKAGFDYADADPRAQENCNKLLSEGYDAFIKDGKTFVIKTCEECGGKFDVVSFRREAGVCQSCVEKMGSNQVDRLRSARAKAKSEKFFDDRASVNKQEQAKVYSGLKFKLGRQPMRKEWEQECKTLGVRFRLKSQRSFQSYDEVIQAGDVYNHKVVSVEKLEGKHMVYNITVDDHHTLACVTHVGKSNQTGVYVLQCGEIIMSTGVCLLLSLNLVRYIIKDGDNYKFDFDTFKKAVSTAVRFADNINDISRVPLPEYKKSMLEKRRIGLGVLGLGSLLYILGIRFGSQESLELIDSIFKTKLETELLASAKLGQEKGNFTLFDKDKYFSTYWWKTLPIDPEIKSSIESIGCMRNSHRAANAPTGNMSIYAGVVSGGIEPVFMKQYLRWSIVPEGDRAELRAAGFQFPDVFKGEWFETINVKAEKRGKDDVLVGSFNGVNYMVDKNRGLTKESLVEDYGWSFVKEYLTNKQLEVGENNGIFATTENLTVDEHVGVMKILAKYVDQNSSKTVNVPKDYPYDSFKNLYMDAWKAGIKGITTYREGTMTAVLEKVDAKDESDGRPTKIIDSAAPKRPKELPCEIHHAKINGKLWIVLVGILDGRPYEVFAGPAETINLSKKVDTGKLVKKSRGAYELVTEDEVIKNVVERFGDNDSAWATRLISMSLRHGVPLGFMCEQLSKDGLVTDANKVISRMLKKYIDPKTTNATCPNCGSSRVTLIGSCLTCMDCTHGKCG